MIVQLVWAIIPLVVFSIIGVSESFAEYVAPERFPYSFYEINSNGTYYFAYYSEPFPKYLEVRNFEDKTTLFYTTSFPDDPKNIIIKFPSDTSIGKKEIIVHEYDGTLTKPATFFYPSIFSTSPHEIIAVSPEPNSVTVVDGDITITLSTDKVAYLEDEVINISWQIENQGNEKIFYKRAYSECNPTLGLVINGSNNSYPLSDLQPKRVNFDPLICPAVYIEPVVLPKSTIKNEFSWNQYVSVSHSNIEKMPVGKYVLQVSYFSSEDQFVTQQKKSVLLPIIIGDINQLSPKKQIELVYLPKEVTCKERLGLQRLGLIFKSTDNSPACVKMKTAIELYKRGWAHNMESDVWDHMAEVAAKQFVLQNLDYDEYSIVERTLESGVYAVRESLPPYVSVAVSVTLVKNDAQSLDDIKKFRFSILVTNGYKVNTDSVNAEIWNKDVEDWEEAKLPFKEGWANEASQIDSFDDCVAAGNPVMESYPRQCRTPEGKHFVESIPEQKQCEITGGLWGIWSNHPSAIESCNPPTSDVGMECTDSSQCQSFCQATEGSEINTEDTGVCYGYELAICMQEVRNGVVEPEWCQ